MSETDAKMPISASFRYIMALLIVRSEIDAVNQAEGQPAFFRTPANLSLPPPLTVSFLMLFLS